MGGGDFIPQRLSRNYFSAGCMSPSCVPVHEEYSRIEINVPAGAGGNANRRSRRRLRKLIKKIMSESKSIYGSKPLTFQYDAVSYSQNFDEGCHRDEYPRCHQLFPDHPHRWHVQQ
ncbi:OLC1v1010618C1 [Oldenlandia corymbosa var. corymbosa]|uniref:OLC1v1010618C1 n=1 Tax=Oldenlandia corymbosa var. corymbosa TaxID=529605 RepID=A0AAV1DU77_OLDCO|nr:OLC1v1010618C1 [Oldenlandia corymbosa var. corymbosa]